MISSQFIDIFWFNYAVKLIFGIEFEVFPRVFEFLSLLPLSSACSSIVSLENHPLHTWDNAMAAKMATPEANVGIRPLLA